MSTQVCSYSKVNLGLAIGPTRPDGFHGLTTVYQTLELHDVVTVQAKRAWSTKIVLTTNDERVPTDGRNTCWKMVERALERLQMAAEVHVHIQKRLPVQGGLGAGSANAAAALIGLERELGLALPGRLSGPARLALATQVGSDVPLFLLGGSVLGLSRGEEVYPLPDLPVTPCVVAVPSVGVSTAAAFRALDARMAADSLTSAPNPSKLEMLSRALSAAWSPSGANLGTSSQISEPSPSGITRQTGDRAEDPLLTLVRTG